MKIAPGIHRIGTGLVNSYLVEDSDGFPAFGGHLLVELRVWEPLGRDHDRENDRLLADIPE